jgi:hypothetical protein
MSSGPPALESLMFAWGDAYIFAYATATSANPAPQGNSEKLSGSLRLPMCGKPNPFRSRPGREPPQSARARAARGGPRMAGGGRRGETGMLVRRSSR